jgi:hypothetical protein
MTRMSGEKPPLSMDASIGWARTTFPFYLFLDTNYTDMFSEKMEPSHHKLMTTNVQCV